MQSDSSDSSGPITQRVNSLPSATDTRGKHRIQAELKRLEQEVRFLEPFPRPPSATPPTSPPKINKENLLPVVRGSFFGFSDAKELEQLDKMENATAACKEILSYVDCRPDPLLQLTNGPLNPAWDRWFEGQQESQGCRCWIL